MPKITYSYAKKKKTPVPQDVLLELVNRYQKARKMTSADMAKALFLSDPQSYRCKKMRGVDLFKLDDFKLICKKLSIPDEEIAKAIIAYINA